MQECLHRFCSDCIITALRSGNKECPTCRKKLVSKRSLRPDPNFDLLISKIYPSRDEYEAIQEKVLAKLNKNHCASALINSITEGIKLQSQNRPNRSRKNIDDHGNQSSQGESSSMGAGTSSSQPDPVRNFQLVVRWKNERNRFNLNRWEIKNYFFKQSILVNRKQKLKSEKKAKKCFY